MEENNTTTNQESNSANILCPACNCENCKKVMPLMLFLAIVAIGSIGFLAYDKLIKKPAPQVECQACPTCNCNEQVNEIPAPAEEISGVSPIDESVSSPVDTTTWKSVNVNKAFNLKYPTDWKLVNKNVTDTWYNVKVADTNGDYVEIDNVPNDVPRAICLFPEEKIYNESNQFFTITRNGPSQGVYSHVQTTSLGEYAKTSERRNINFTWRLAVDTDRKLVNKYSTNTKDSTHIICEANDPKSSTCTANDKLEECKWEVKNGGRVFYAATYVGYILVRSTNATNEDVIKTIINNIKIID